MKKTLFLILLLLAGVLTLPAVPSYRMRSCAPMQSGYATPASSASAYPRIGYSTAPAASYGRHGTYATTPYSPYSPYSAMPRSHTMTPATFASSQAPAYAPSAPQGMGPRKVHSDGMGGYEGDYNGEYYGGQWWNTTDEEWVDEPFDGCKKIEGGLTYEYQGGTWVLITNQADPDAPIGDTPWLFFLLLAVGYAAVKRCLRHVRMPLRDVKKLKS